MTHSSKQQGFSTVELLITLFVAAAFILTGYQLYRSIVRDGLSARERSVASNVAYAALRTYSSQAVSPCAVKNNADLSPTPALPAGTKLTSPTITVSITCPYGAATSNTSKVEVRVQYGSPQEEVTHALFVY